MEIIREEKMAATRESLEFFKKYHGRLGKVQYLVLYDVESIPINPIDKWNHVIFIGEHAQLWLRGLTWGYSGEGPYGLYKVLQKLDLEFTYEEIVALKWEAREIIVLKNMGGKLMVSSYEDSIRTMLLEANSTICWPYKSLMKPKKAIAQ